MTTASVGSLRREAGSIDSQSHDKTVSMEITRGDLDLGSVEHDAAAVISGLGRRTFARTMTGGVGFGHRDATVSRIGADLVAAAAGQVEAVDVGDGIELGRPVPELFGDEMDHQPLALHTAAHAQEARAHDDAAVRVEDPWPDD